LIQFEIYQSDPQIANQNDNTLSATGLFSDSAKGLIFMKVRFQSSQTPMIKINACIAFFKVERFGTAMLMIKVIISALDLPVLLTSFQIQPIN